MTESLLQQARQLIVEIEMMREMHDFSDPTYTKLHAFLDAVIPILERQDGAVEYIEYDQRKEQRTHTLAIMTAILASVSNDPKFDSIAMAELLLAKVEERQR